MANRSEYKRRVLSEEVARRVGLMRASEIDTEFAPIENGYEVRIRFVPEPFVSVAAQQPAAEANPNAGAQPSQCSSR